MEQPTFAKGRFRLATLLSVYTDGFTKELGALLSCVNTAIKGSTPDAYTAVTVDTQ